MQVAYKKIRKERECHDYICTFLALLIIIYLNAIWIIDIGNFVNELLLFLLHLLLVFILLLSMI